MADVTTELVSTYFLHPTFPHINTDPMYTYIENWFLLAVENLASVTSELVGDNHGWVGTAVSDAMYATYSAIPWDDPIDSVPNITYPMGANKNDRRVIDNAVNGA